MRALLADEESMKTDATVEAKIRDALIRFDAGIRQSEGAAISAALGELEGYWTQHRAELDPRLAHFLQNRSYAKALAWLEGKRV